VAQVPTRIQCEVNRVFQLGSKTGNKVVYNKYNVAGKPLPTGKSPNKVAWGSLNINECKNVDKPGRARCYKSKIRKQRSFEKEPLQKASEKRNNPSEDKN
jgi:hypothetical protein